jgi:anti-sigma regulatory factor (Ser/Thr protein kinase)
MESNARPPLVRTFSADPAAVPASREAVKALLRSWGRTDLEDDATLVTSELVGNAIRYGDEIVLTVRQDDQERVVVEVWDPAPEAPVRHEAGELDEDGRGLLLVEMCSDEWGCTPGATSGKTVWAKIK